MTKFVADHTKLTIDELLYMIGEMKDLDKFGEIEAFIKQLRNVWKILEYKTIINCLLLYFRRIAFGRKPSVYCNLAAFNIYL